MIRNFFLLIGVTLTLGCGTAPTASQPADKPEFSPAVPAVNVLMVGSKLPPLQAEGWVNGPPPALGAAGQKLLVVDVWAHWCPYCRSSCPGLLRAHEKYASQGVQFVGLTNLAEAEVTDYVRQNKLTWANGYSTPPETLVALGAGSGMSIPGYEVAPILYLVGPDGVIRWTDERGRMRHTDPEVWGKAVDEAIAAALAAPPVPARRPE